MAELAPLGILRADQPAKTRRRDFHPRAIALAETLASSTWENAGPVFLRGTPLEEALPTPQRPLAGRMVTALRAVGSAGIRCADLARDLCAGDDTVRALLHQMKEQGRVTVDAAHVWRFRESTGCRSSAKEKAA